MLPRNYTSEGIILSRKNYSEADKILVIFSKHYGKLSLLAKGVRKPKSKKRGHIEIFSRVRFSAHRGKNMDLMTEAELIDSFNSIRRSLKRVSLAYYFVEVLDRIVREHEENLKLYQLILRFLNALKTTKNLKSLRIIFVSELLTLLGFWSGEKILKNPDVFLEEVLERRISSVRVGKKLLL